MQCATRLPHESHQWLRGLWGGMLHYEHCQGVDASQRGHGTEVAPVIRAGIPPEALEERCADCGQDIVGHWGRVHEPPSDGAFRLDWDAYAEAIGRMA